MFKDFDISSFKKQKPPSDNSFDTDQEIKALKKIPLRKDFVKKYDDIQPCPKCKKAQGWNWTWGKNDGASKGFSTCKGCGAKF